jgi:hypothetical protein
MAMKLWLFKGFIFIATDFSFSIFFLVLLHPSNYHQHLSAGFFYHKKGFAEMVDCVLLAEVIEVFRNE